MKKLMLNMHSSSILSGVVASVVFLTMAGCASKPVTNSTRTVTIPQYYTVKAGDTLSQIAARYGLDYREIARINNINSDYIIYTNQSLRLYRGGVKHSTPVTTATKPREVIRAQALPTSNKPVNTPVRSPNITNNVPPVTNNSVISSTNTQSGIAWSWPANGQIIQQFNPAQGVKGIRIAGQQGDTVRAAADGEVVYASDRLTEYGNLILIRHFVNGYVTAYAHNSKMVVSENQRVKAGQKIAEMGSTGTQQVMLEFQIRLNGKPIDPLSLLPQR